jgi:DNA-binding Xre family transcriptional regulator
MIIAAVRPIINYKTKSVPFDTLRKICYENK